MIYKRWVCALKVTNFLGFVMYFQQAMDEVQLLKCISDKAQFVLCEVGTENTECRNVVTPNFNAGLVARSHYASGRSRDPPNQSRLSVGFFGSRANDERLPKFQGFAAHSSCNPLSSNFKISAQTQPTSEQTFVKL